MAKAEENSRLSRNFHRTFKPERLYLNAMLRFASAGKSGDFQSIAASTGIPTGESTGKVPAILEYCQGMGLLRLENSDRTAVKKPVLTDFGRMVLIEDPFLKTGITQWLAHLNLCSPITGADVWYYVFFKGLHQLGLAFERSKLDSYLKVVYGTDKSGLIGPLVGMYGDEACFTGCGVLVESGSEIRRRAAPTAEEYGIAYSAWLLQLMADHFHGRNQITVTELENEAGWRSIPGWDVGAHQRILALVERKGLVEIDRQMDPWLVKAKCSCSSAWKKIYSEVI
jgi:hypothetical protein